MLDSFILSVNSSLAEFTRLPSPTAYTRRCTHTHAHERVRVLVSDDGAGNGVSDETELTQVDLPRRWRGAPDT